MGEAMSPTPAGANAAVESLLDDRLGAIESAFESDGLAIYGPLEFGLDDTVRRVVEQTKAKGDGRERLVVLVDTDGGYLDVVNRIVDTIRHHYKIVAFVIPNAAYSAGTILAMSGDSIHMDYYSRLGPIDPQVPSESGEMIPALGYLKRYEDLVERSKSEEGLSLAEVQLLVSGFDQAQLYKYDQARELSVTLLSDWLCKYKFKDWVKTQDRGLDVTEAIRKQRAAEVANQLNDTDRWHSHSNGISADVLREELKLRIDDFGEHKEAIAEYHDLLKDYTSLNRVFGVVHARGMYVPYHVH
jgi:hypothetical protein